jgi:ADP-ribose pyrophosphatase
MGLGMATRERIENVRIHPGDATAGEIEILEERAVWENASMRLCVAAVTTSKGPAEQARIGHPDTMVDGVVVVPIDEQDRILLIRQFRHPVRMWMRELPRGGRNRGETPAETARRELHEEIGYEASEIVSLGRIATDSGMQEGFPHLLAARVQRAGDSEPEAGEAIDGVFPYRYDELARLCERGEIVDSFTLAAVTRLRPHFRDDRFVYRQGLVEATED